LPGKGIEVNLKENRVETDRRKLFHRLQNCRGQTIIVDFDETLWLSNSSGRYNGTVIPEFYGFLIDKIIRVIFNNIGEKYFVWRDFV
jgi:hypothetical protein